MTLSERIKKNTEDFLEGKINYLPFPDLGGFTKVFPGLMRGDVSAIIGLPADGKSSLWKRLIVHGGVEWAFKNKKNFHILAFLLEETEIQFDYSLLSYSLWKKHGLRYNLKDFICVGKSVDPKHFPQIEDAEKRVNIIKSYVTCYDNIMNSYGIYKAVRDFAWERGKFYKGDVLLTDKNELTEGGWTKYVPDDPDEFIVIAIDHLLQLHPQKNQKDISQAIGDLVEDLRAYAAKHFNYSVVFLQHAASSVESSDNRQRQEVLPNITNLARNTEVGRSFLNIISVTNINRTNTVGPGNTGIQSWDGINVPKMGNHMRVINISKSRYGESNVNFPLWFDGKVGEFEAIDKSNLNKYYDRVKSYSQPIKNDLFQ